jgi:hypothetical protein
MRFPEESAKGIIRILQNAQWHAHCQKTKQNKRVDKGKSGHARRLW